MIRLVCLKFLRHSTGVDMNQASGPKAKLESNEEHWDAGPGNLGTKHQC